MAHMKEESSYLPDTVIPEKIEKKKIIKKVRFHDDNPVVVGQESIPRVGTKRLYKNDDISFDHQEDEDQNEEALLEQECEQDFEKIEQKREAKR